MLNLSSSQKKRFQDIATSRNFLLDIKYTVRYFFDMKTTVSIKKSEKTRQFIIEKSAPVFNKKGVAGTSLSDLTQATGLTKGSIYGNFKDKDAVALAAFEYNVNNLMSYLGRSINKQGSYLDKLLAIPEAYRKLYRQMIDFGGCPIANTATEADDTHPELKKLTIQTVEKLTWMTEKLVEKGKQAGEIQHLVDSRKTANIIISLIEGGSILSKVTGQRQFLKHSLEQIEYLIHSIRLQV